MKKKDAKDEPMTEPTEASLQNESSSAPAPGAADEAQKLRDEMLYLRADFENVKRRLLREQENAIKFANEKMIADLINVVDTFERALESGKAVAGESESSKTFYAGVELTHRELTNLLNRFGVELVGSVGEKFDPSRHEAVSQVTVESDKVDTVVGLVQRGALLQGRLLKPARVVVGIAK